MLNAFYKLSISRVSVTGIRSPLGEISSVKFGNSQSAQPTTDSARASTSAAGGYGGGSSYGHTGFTVSNVDVQTGASSSVSVINSPARDATGHSSYGQSYVPTDFLASWRELAAKAPGLVREIDPIVQYNMALETWNKTRSMAAVVSQMGFDVVQGGVEHSQGFGIITVQYRVTPKGMAAEFSITSPDGYETTIKIYLRDLLNPPPERVADAKNYKPVPELQIKQQLLVEEKFMLAAGMLGEPGGKGATTSSSSQLTSDTQEALVVSLGHQVGSDRNWMYLYSRDPKDPTLVTLVSIRLPDDLDQALAVRDRLLALIGRPDLIPENRFDAVILTGDKPIITPQAIAAAFGTELFGISPGELKDLGSNGFKVIQDAQNAEAQRLVGEILEKLDASDFETVEEMLQYAMYLFGVYLNELADRNLQGRGRNSANPEEPGPGADSGAGGDGDSIAGPDFSFESGGSEVGAEPYSAQDQDDERAVTEEEEVAKLEDGDAEREVTSEAEGGGDEIIALRSGLDLGDEIGERAGLSEADAQEETDRTNSDADLTLATVEAESDDLKSTETEGGDDIYQPVIIEDLDALEPSSITEKSEEEDSDSQLSMILDLSGEADGEKADVAELEEGAPESAVELLLLEELDEQARTRELIAELGGDVGLLATEEVEMSAFGSLMADGELPAFSELADFHELLMAAEITDNVVADLEDLLELDSSVLSVGAEQELVSEELLDQPITALDRVGGDGIELVETENDGSLAAQDGAEELTDGLQSASASSDVSSEEEAGIQLEKLSDNDSGGEAGADKVDAVSESGDADAGDQIAGEQNAGDERDQGGAGAEQSSDFESEADGDLFAAELAGALDDADVETSPSARQVRAGRRRSAMRALNRLKFQAEALGINVFELMKLRQRRGLKRLWFEQLVFALAREMKFTFEQRQALARELELSSADFDDIRQAELAVRRELHARKMRTRVLEAIQNQ